MKSRLPLTILVSLIIIGGGVAVFANQKNKLPQTRQNNNATIGELEYYHANQFFESIQSAKALTNSFPINENIKAIIVPHDLLHAEFIAQALKNIQGQAPENILIIGPNHYESGASNIISSDADWSTPYGKIQSNKTIIEAMKKSGLTTLNTGILQHEHSINGLLPYLAYYLPRSKIIPLILKSEITLSDIESISQNLDSILPPNTLVIASVDFSHYLSADQAAANDIITKHALETLDYRSIMSFGSRFNDFVDSPPTIGLLLYWLKTHNINNSKILYNTNSGILSHDYSQPVTSYFEAVFY